MKGIHEGLCGGGRPMTAPTLFQKGFVILQGVEVVVAAVEGQQLLVGALLDDLAVIDIPAGDVLGGEFLSLIEAAKKAIDQRESEHK